LIQSDLALRDLVGIRDLGPLSADVIPLITIVHNELPRLPDFLRQYRHLGVGRFIIVDHRSNDGTSAYRADHVRRHSARPKCIFPLLAKTEERDR